MKYNFKLKKMKREIIYVCVVCASFALSSCSNVMSDKAANSTFSAFEKEFADRLSPDNKNDKNVVKLIGFKTFPIEDDSLKQNYKTMIESDLGKEMRQRYAFADDFSFFRMYFPLHTAIVDYDGKTYTADEKGMVSIPNLKDTRKIKVIGRKKSETVTGAGSNTIEDDRILLKNELKQETINGVQTGYSIEGNICVFDMGFLVGMF